MLLPSRDIDVTPPLKVYRRRDPTEYVKAILQLDVHDPRYQRDKWGTYCNVYAHDALTVTGAPLPRRKDGWAMLANDMKDYLADAKNGWQHMVWQDAVSNALLGFPTVSALTASPNGHITILLPANADELREILVAQAGATNFYGRQIIYSYNEKNLKLVQFYGWPH